MSADYPYAVGAVVEHCATGDLYVVVGYAYGYGPTPWLVARDGDEEVVHLPLDAVQDTIYNALSRALFGGGEA